MKINGISASNTMFSGRVYSNYQKTVEEIAKCPYETQEPIIDNLNILKRILSNKPDDKTYILDFEHKTQTETGTFPVYHYGVISVKDEKGNSVSSSFELAKMGGLRKDDKTEVASAQDIWQNGFKEITQKAFITPFSPNDETENIEKACEQRGWDIETYAPLIAEIADKIELRGKTYINKAEVAASILNAAKQCPHEFKEGIIININSLTKKMEENAAKEKAYILTTDDSSNSDGLYIRFDAVNSTVDSEYAEGYLPTNMDADSSEAKFNTSYFDIYQNTFNPLYKKLWVNFNHFLPFDLDYNKTQILDKLV